MKAVIPVAGLGSRLRPHTFSAPKALVPVAGKPILSHILDDLMTLDVRDLILIVGQMSDHIRSYVDRTYPFRTEYVVQEETLGIAHALYQCRPHIDDEPLLIVLGDTVYHSDFSILRSGLSSSAVGVKALQGDLSRFGLVEVRDGHIVRLVEKPEHPPSDLVIAGVYYIAHPQMLMESVDALIRNRQTTHGEYQLTDALQLMIEQGEQMTVFTVDEWYDCGTPERLLATNRRLLDLQNPVVEVDGALVIPPVAIADDVHITASVIGPHVTVASGATIERSVITDSVICDHAIVRDCRLHESIVGTNAAVNGMVQKVNIGELSEVEVIP